jgi:hypothetical protein
MEEGADSGGHARVSVAVMAHPSRRAWAVDLAEHLDCEVVWDRYNNVWDTARRAWLSHHPNATHHLVVQDDAVLCRNLRAALPEIVKWRPNSLISLIAIKSKLSQADRSRHDRAVESGERWFSAKAGLPGCALMLPVPDIAPMVMWGDVLKSPHDDVKISAFYRSQGKPAHYVVPSLVQHRHQSENPSLVNPAAGWRPRQSDAWVGEDWDASAGCWAPANGKVIVEKLTGPPQTFRNLHTGRTVVVVDRVAASQMASARRWVQVDAETLPLASQALR